MPKVENCYIHSHPTASKQLTPNCRYKLQRLEDKELRYDSVRFMFFILPEH
jgi:hypothetical protein